MADVDIAVAFLNVGSQVESDREVKRVGSILGEEDLPFQSKNPEKDKNAANPRKCKSGSKIHRKGRSKKRNESKWRSSVHNDLSGAIHA